MRLAIWVTLAFAVTACQPSDQNVRTVRDRVLRGEAVEFTKPGYRQPGCGDRKADWSIMELKDQDEWKRVVLRKQGSIIDINRSLCYRVGSQVMLTPKGTKASRAGGRAVITKLTMIRLDRLQSQHMKGSYFNAASALNSYRSDFQFRLQPYHEGIVMIVDFDYVGGSSPYESKLREEEREEENTDTYEETKSEGEVIRNSKCGKNPWLSIDVPVEFQTDLIAGNLKSWYRLGPDNCLKQGQAVAIKTHYKDEADVATGKVVKIKRFKTRFLLAERFLIPNFSFDRLKTHIEAENARRSNEEYLTVVDLEISPSNGSTP